MVRTLRERIELHDNDYSSIEPFSNSRPIDTTIIIPVYNQAKLFLSTWKVLARQNELNENPENFQVVVVNDGSGEDIDVIIGDCQFPTKIRYVKLEQNTGRSHARNTGIKEAINELIFFFDSDVLVPDNFFQAHWRIHHAAQIKKAKAAVVGLAENIENHDEIVGKYLEGQIINPDPTKDFRVYDDGSDWYPPRRESKLLEESRDLKQFPVLNFTLPEMVVTHSISINRELLNE